MENLTDKPPARTYEAQLTGRAAELLGGIGTEERLELLAVMDPDDMRASLAFVVSLYPRVFDFALVRDEAMTVRLLDRLDEDQVDEVEPFCQTCRGLIGIFISHGDAWLHFRGEGTAASPVELFDAGHEPAAAWRSPVGEQ